MRLRHPDLDTTIEAPDDAQTIAVHERAGWVADVPPERDTELVAVADQARQLISEGLRLDDPTLLDDADRLIMHTVHHGGVRPWEMFAAGGPGPERPAPTSPPVSGRAQPQEESPND